MMTIGLYQLPPPAEAATRAAGATARVEEAATRAAGATARVEEAERRIRARGGNDAARKREREDAPLASAAAAHMQEGAAAAHAQMKGTEEEPMPMDSASYASGQPMLLHQVLDVIKRTSGILCGKGEGKLQYIQRVAHEIGVSLRPGQSLTSSAHEVLADIAGSHPITQDHAEEEATRQRPPLPPAPAPAALAGRKRRHGSGPVEGVGGGEMSPSPGSSSEQGDMTYSQERLHLKLARLHAVDEVTRSTETNNRLVEMRVLEEELRLKSHRRKRRQ